jgi:ribonuclease HII
MRTLGIDEAGRGPVLGPLVVAGVLCHDQEALRILGVRDSKRLSPQRRRGLAEEIQRVAECRVRVIAADELDEAMEGSSLNAVEANCFAEVIRDLSPDEAYVDCCDTSEARFKRTILRYLGYDVPLHVEHGADDRYPVVSAASILAKVRRDQEMRCIEEELGQPVGSGYAHDPQTLAFLQEYFRSHGAMPPHARQSWKTSRRLLSKTMVRKLTEWD